jgi:DNA polymerase II small subunit
MYRGVLIVNSGAWQTQTPYQTSIGITPTPGIAVIINLATLKVFRKDFTE